ncbi:hypothetical protein FRC17_000213, partial [Serendipita sp. 399]
ETDPLVVTIKPLKPVLEHDFTQGACLVPVVLRIQNYSPTNPVRYVLRLPGTRTSPTHQNSFVATYSGQLTFRGLLDPLQSSMIGITLRAGFAGHYILDGWRLEVEVGETVPAEDAARSDERGDSGGKTWTTRARYLQHPNGSEGTVTIKNLLQRNISHD